jgi:regulator of sigma E protease
MQILSWIYVAVAVVLLFGATIFVHEFGHFWMARRRGLRVDGFSIGFGPKVFGWTRDGIDYALRWIPAGGYVKLPQMVTSEAIEGKSDVDALPPVSPWSKILVALAGPFMNILFAFVIASVIYVVGLPIRVNPAVIGHVEPGSEEAKSGVREGDRIVAVSGKQVKSWEDAQMAVAIARTNVLPVTVERDGARTVLYLRAAVNEEIGLKLLDLEPMQHPVIREIKAESAAQAAGLKTGDEVLSFAGVPVVGQEQLVSLIKKRPGQETEMEIARDGRTMSLKVTPQVNQETGGGLLGVLISANVQSVYQLQRPGPLPWVLVGDVVQTTFSTLGALLHSKQTGIGVKDLSGPPGILAMLAVELKADIRLALRFLVLLNVSLGILNLLPFPVLDGGHIVMALVEKLRGRPLSRRVQEYATSTFALLLLSLMLYVSYNDVIKRFPLFRFMFTQQVRIQNEATPGQGPSR